MKKFLTMWAIAFTCSVSVIHAQISKGSLFLGGNISGNTLKTEGNSPNSSSKQNGITISPVIGVAIRENLVFGADLGFSFYKNDQLLVPYSQKQTGYSAGVFLRKYKPIGKGFYIFLQGRFGAGYQEGKNTPGYGYANTKRVTLTVSGYPGISYAINRKLQLETGFNNLLSLNYYHEKGDNYGVDDTFYKTNSFNLATSLDNFSSIYIGFRLLIGK
jgi:hypothetical protein